MSATQRRLAMLSMALPCFVYAAGAAAQPSYHLEVIAPMFIPVAVNDRNQVVGFASNRETSPQIGLWTAGAKQPVAWQGGRPRRAWRH
jgi:hypothetical protein